MMRRYGFLVMAAVLLLAGCGKKDAGSAEQTAKPASGETFTLKIGKTVSDIDPFNVAYREFEEEVERLLKAVYRWSCLPAVPLARRMPTCWTRYAPIPFTWATPHPIVLPTFPECLSIMYMEFHI